MHHIIGTTLLEGHAKPAEFQMEAVELFISDEANSSRQLMNALKSGRYSTAFLACERDVYQKPPFGFMATPQKTKIEYLDEGLAEYKRVLLLRKKVGDLSTIKETGFYPRAQKLYPIVKKSFMGDNTQNDTLGLLSDTAIAIAEVDRERAWVKKVASEEGLFFVGNTHVHSLKGALEHAGNKVEILYESNGVPVNRSAEIQRLVSGMLNGGPNGKAAPQAASA